MGPEHVHATAAVLLSPRENNQTCLSCTYYSIPRVCVSFFVFFFLSCRYAAESLPGITQALSDGDLSLAQEQVLVAAARVSDAAAFLSGGGEGGA